MKMSFNTEFEYYLKAEKKFEQNTIHKTIQKLKQMLKVAVGLDFLGIYSTTFNTVFTTSSTCNSFKHA